MNLNWAWFIETSLRCVSWPFVTIGHQTQFLYDAKYCKLGSVTNFIFKAI